MNTSWVHQVLEAMRVDKGQRIFVLGCFERRVTLYSQQVRALNLVDALFRAEELREGESVAVVGAGVAGLTFAAGAAKRGAHVTVLEKEDLILPLLRYNPNRWLHPRVYDWPMPGWEHARAGLPVLDWSAGNVANVREEIERGWRIAAAGAPERSRVITQVTDVVPGDSDNRGIWLSWNAPDANDCDSKRFALIVLAVGFGVEKEEVPDYRGYWEPDKLDQSDGFRPDKDKPKSWLVSGCGDGALTDLLRLCIRDFRHDRMVQDFASLPDIKNMMAQIQEIEANPRAKGPTTPDFLFHEYRELHLRA